MSNYSSPKYLERIGLLATQPQGVLIPINLTGKVPNPGTVVDLAKDTDKPAITHEGVVAINTEPRP